MSWKVRASRSSLFSFLFDLDNEENQPYIRIGYTVTADKDRDKELNNTTGIAPLELETSTYKNQSNSPSTDNKHESYENHHKTRSSMIGDTSNIRSLVTSNANCGTVVTSTGRHRHSQKLNSRPSSSCVRYIEASSCGMDITTKVNRVHRWANSLKSNSIYTKLRSLRSSNHYKIRNRLSKLSDPQSQSVRSKLKFKTKSKLRTFFNNDEYNGDRNDNFRYTNNIYENGRNSLEIDLINNCNHNFNINETPIIKELNESSYLLPITYSDDNIYNYNNINETSSIGEKEKDGVHVHFNNSNSNSENRNASVKLELNELDESTKLTTLASLLQHKQAEFELSCKDTSEIDRDSSEIVIKSPNNSITTVNSMSSFGSKSPNSSISSMSTPSSSTDSDLPNEGNNILSFECKSRHKKKLTINTNTTFPSSHAYEEFTVQSVAGLSETPTNKNGYKYIDKYTAGDDDEDEDTVLKGIEKDKVTRAWNMYLKRTFIAKIQQRLSVDADKTKFRLYEDELERVNYIEYDLRCCN